MNIAPEFIRVFPEYEDVFAQDVALCKEHFLPICSINLQCIDSEYNQWLHFVSPKEIYDGCLGQNTEAFHTAYCKMDMIGFDIIGDKYRFEADWNYFEITSQRNQATKMSNLQATQLFRSKLNQFESQEAVKDWVSSLGEGVRSSITSKLISKFVFLTNSDSDPELVKSTLDLLENQALQADNDSLEGAYKLNTDTYQLAKDFYKKHQVIYPMTIGNYNNKISTMQQLESSLEKNKQYIEYPEFWGVIDDIKFESKEEKDCFKEFDILLEDALSFEDTNLIAKPYDQDGQIFEYIGRLTGYLFQCYGADALYLFYNKEMKKAVMCLEYT